LKIKVVPKHDKTKAFLSSTELPLTDKGEFVPSRYKTFLALSDMEKQPVGDIEVEIRWHIPKRTIDDNYTKKRRVRRALLANLQFATLNTKSLQTECSRRIVAWRYILRQLDRDFYYMRKENEMMRCLLCHTKTYDRTADLVKHLRQWHTDYTFNVNTVHEPSAVGIEFSPSYMHTSLQQGEYIPPRVKEISTEEFAEQFPDSESVYDQRYVSHHVFPPTLFHVQ